ncbi:MAG: hypothetical protein HZB19_16620 [Chloroflexi bacterium]|nr:hypothetical protein [Chloroflexota bacterium]
MIQLIKAVGVFLLSQFWGFAIGVISSIVASFIVTAIDKTKSLHKAERMILQSISHRRLRKIHRIDDPHAIIRTEWAVALRDLGSKRPGDVLRALESLAHMADILEPDEREVAREALRLRIAFNNTRDTDKRFLGVMEELS